MKKRFLREIALSNTHSSGFQHACVYTKNAAESDKKDKEAFQECFREKLVELEQAYKNRVSEDEHIQNIQAFADQLSREFPQVLANGKMRTGVAQKAVNVHLKFLWCLEWIPEPPHCPVDKVVLGAIGNTTRWTKMDGIDPYKDIIAQIREHIQNSGTGKSLAQWELELWNEYRRKQMSNNGV